MTTTTIDRRPTVGGTSLNRVIAVMKLQFTNPWTIIVVPVLILLAILVMNIMIWWIVYTALSTDKDRADFRDGLGYGGAAMYIFIYMLVVAVQAISAYFPLALGYSITRRNYYLGTALTFVVLSAIFTVVMGILGAIEEATDGWGVGGHMFTANYFGDGWVQRAFVDFVLLLFFFFIGSTVAAIYVRFHAIGMIVFFGGLAFLLIGIAALATFTQGWPAIGGWFVTTGLIGTYAWSLVLTAIAALSGYLILRRATPKS